MRILLVLLAYLLATPQALAHGSDRLKVTETILLDATPETVWAAVGNFHDLAWDPAIVKTEGDGGNTVDSFRTTTLGNNGTIAEQLVIYDATKMTYSTFLPHNDPAVLPITNFSTILTVKPASSGGTEVVWRAAGFRGYPNDNPPPALNDEVAVKAMHDYLRAGLDALRRRFGRPNGS
nr:SRPBCC family protein [uncultured Rhodopila sp.]